MEKYKICPSCKTKNPPTLLECLNCETDLSRVRISDDTDEQPTAEAPVVEDEKTPVQRVRVCACGTKNPPNARKCSSCNEDISDVTPVPDAESEERETAAFVLSSLDGQYAYRVSNDVTIGRESSMKEHLSPKSYVSRIHAKLTIEDDGLYIEDLNSTNCTYVNNRRITEKTKLQDGDEIGLGGTAIDGKRQEEAAYFLVRAKKCM